MSERGKRGTGHHHPSTHTYLGAREQSWQMKWQTSMPQQQDDVEGGMRQACQTGRHSACGTRRRRTSETKPRKRPKTTLHVNLSHLATMAPQPSKKPFHLSPPTTQRRLTNECNYRRAHTPRSKRPSFVRHDSPSSSPTAAGMSVTIRSIVVFSSAARRKTAG